MSHEIETGTNGQAAFFTAREDAWHQLGTVTRECLTAEEVMSVAHLGEWNVRKLALTATEITENGVTSIEVPRTYATVRNNPFTAGKVDVLGVVGEDYTVVQNEEHCELLNLLVDESGAHFETAGSLRDGRETFVTMKLPRTIELAGSEGRDDVDLYIAAMSSHDGTTAWRTIVTPVRIVCANTQRMALRAAKSTYALRHTSGARGRIAEARSALGMVWKYADAFETAAQDLVNRTLAVDEFQSIIDAVWNVDREAEVSARSEGIRDRRNGVLLDLFTGASTQQTITGTRWAGLQAVTEYLDHFAPAKDEGTRAARVLTSRSVAEHKEKAHALLAAR